MAFIFDPIIPDLNPPQTQGLPRFSAIPTEEESRQIRAEHDAEMARLRVDHELSQRQTFLGITGSLFEDVGKTASAGITALQLAAIAGIVIGGVMLARQAKFLLR